MVSGLVVDRGASELILGAYRTGALIPVLGLEIVLKSDVSACEAVVKVVMTWDG